MRQSSQNQTRPPWKSPSNSYPQLTQNLDTELCVIGAGISGLLTAYRASKEGLRVLVLDDGPVGGGESGRTTAHLASAVDDRFYRIAAAHGDEAARLCYESHAAAIDWLELIVQREEISCDFERLDGYLFLPPGEQGTILELELSAAQKAGFRGVERVSRAPLEYDTGPCLRFPRQGQFEPSAFLAGLANAVDGMGGCICSGTHVSQIESSGERVTVHCEGNVSVSARWVVVATNSPINDRLTMHTKQHAHRTYAIALEVPAGSTVRSLYWDTSQEPGDAGGPYHYARIHRSKGVVGQSENAHDLLIVGGEDHRTGQADDAAARWARLESWARSRFPVIGEAQNKWSGQVMEPVDFLAFLGPNPSGPDGVYIITGDSGMGLTHAAIGAILIIDQMQGRPNPWSKLYDPSRVTMSTALNFAKENLNAAIQYTDWFKKGDVSAATELSPGEGGLVRHGLKLLACYRDHLGELHQLSATCPHLGGVVRWNSAEQTWDCPCHGSRFSVTGEVLNGPAVEPLENCALIGVRQ